MSKGRLKMAETLYASFTDPSRAEKATGALLDYGLKNEDISLISSSGGTDDAGEKGGMAAAATAPGSSRIGSGSYEAPGGASARTVSVGDAEPRPAVGGLGATATAYGTSTPGDIPDTDAATEPERAKDPVNTAEWGISTTTAEDAESGALKGAGYGLAAGIIAGLTAIFVPGGWGLVVGGGALATAIGGAVGATAAGAVAGGATGYMKDQGVEEEYAAKYDEAIRGGGAVLSIHLPSGEVTSTIARELLAKYGAENVSTAPPRM